MSAIAQIWSLLLVRVDGRWEWEQLYSVLPFTSNSKFLILMAAIDGLITKFTFEVYYDGQVAQATKQSDQQKYWLMGLGHETFR